MFDAFFLPILLIALVWAMKYNTQVLKLLTKIGTVYLVIRILLLMA
jgi:hypothetical protein